MDGLTIVTYGKVHVTRGNGIIGEIVTDTAKQASGIGEESNYIVRSEAVLLHSQFNAINKARETANLEPFKNCRNGAAGMIRASKNPLILGLKIFSYNILNSELTASEQIEELTKLGWNCVESYKPNSIEDALSYIKNYDRTKLDYDIDGLVIKHDGHKEFGETEHHPLNAIAIKFEAEGAWTKLTNINWTVGRTGIITPIAEFEEVEVMESKIEKATLHNFNILKAKHLDKIYYDEMFSCSTEVYVIKSNDVIPKIINIRNTSTFTSISVKEPEVCPVCGAKTVHRGDLLFCENRNCSAKIVNRLIHLASRDAFNIESLGEETAEKIFNKFKITSPIEIFSLTKEQILSLDGFAEKSAEKLYSEINKAKNIDFNKFIYGLGIPLIGKKVALDIAECYGNVLELIKDTDCKKLNDVPGIGASIINSFKDNKDLIIEYLDILNVKNQKKKKYNQKQKIFVITGKFNISRNEIKKLIESYGHKVTGSVSSKTNYVVVGEDAGSKKDKAEELNIALIASIEDLERILVELQ